MRYRTLLVVAALGVMQAHAQIVIGGYPRLDVSPATPVAGDEVSIQVVNGMHSNSCVPAYSDTAVRIEISPLAIYPPQYSVHVRYVESWPSQGDCMAVMTEYGPSFDLGVLALGSYYVYDGDSLVGTFAVADPCSVGGTVYNDVGNSRMMAVPQDSVMVRIAPDYSIYVLDASAPIPFPGSQYRDSALTDRNGTFMFPRVPPGLYRLSFAKKGFITQAFGLSVTEDTTFLIRLIPEGVRATIHGTVASACSNGPDTVCLQPSPMPGCTVWAMLSCDNVYVPMGVDAPILCERWVAVSDSLGRYVFDSLPITRSGEWANVSISVQGFAVQSVDTVVAYGFPTTVDFVMYRSELPVTRRSGLDTHGGAAVVRTAGAGLVVVRAGTAQRVRMEVFGLDGRREPGSVREEWVSAGTHTLSVVRSRASGMRLVRVSVDGTQHTVVDGVSR